jgi:NDP-sugar pyrophosphorylase family protein
MVPVAGRPLVEWQLEWLKRSGVTDVVFLCGYKADILEAHVGDGSRVGLRVQYSREAEPLGRGGALKRGWLLVPPGEACVLGCNGDIITDQALAPLFETHRANEAAATIMLSALCSPFGIVEVADDGRVLSFREKPILPYWVNAGIYVLSAPFFDLLPDMGDHETTTFPALAEEGKLFAFKSEAYWRPVDSIKDLSEAEKELRRAR